MHRNVDIGLGLHLRLSLTQRPNLWDNKHDIVMHQFSRARGD